MRSLQIVNKYLDIIFVENNNGEGLSSILADDFLFDDPFTKATGAQDFISKTKNWIQTKKSIHMQTQFAEGNKVCSIYSIEVLTPYGNNVRFQLADYIELTGEKISKEIVYFKDPVNFANAMGFKDDYLKQY